MSHSVNGQCSWTARGIVLLYYPSWSEMSPDTLNISLLRVGSYITEYLQALAVYKPTACQVSLGYPASVITNS